MKEKLANLGKSFWHYANTNVGSVLIGATAAYMYTKGSREEELIETKEKLQKMESRLLTKEIEMTQSSQQLRDLLRAKMDVDNELAASQRQRDFYRYSHENSWCFLRQHYSEHYNSRFGDKRKNIEQSELSKKGRVLCRKIKHFFQKKHKDGIFLLH